MKKYLLIVIFLLVLVLSLFFWKRGRSFDFPSDVVAISKIGNVTTGDIQNYLQDLQQISGQQINIDSLEDEYRKMIINEIFNNKVILEDAKKSGVKNSKKFKSKLEKYSDNLMRELFLEDKLSGTIDDSSLKKKYDELVSLLKDKKEYKVKHILVKTKPEIDKVIRELRNKTFEDVASKYSIDTSKDSGGDLGYILDDQTVSEFNEVLKKQPLSKLSEPFETQFGWHILIKEDERKATIPDFDSVKETLRDNLARDFIRNYSLKNLERLDIKIIN